MAIKEAKQSGNRVVIKAGNTSTSLNGTLIGYTQKAVFIKNNRNLHIFIDRNGSIAPTGCNIVIGNNEEVKMFGNCVGIQNDSNVKLYDENGHSAGTKRI